LGLNVATVQGSHNANPREHRRAAVAFGDQDQRFDCGLPFLDLLLGLRQLLNIFAGVLESDKLAAAGQRYRIFERPVPALG
jgi:hypothetical protein